jgi:hypothetical protein
MAARELLPALSIHLDQIWSNSIRKILTYECPVFQFRATTLCSSQHTQFFPPPISIKFNRRTAYTTRWATGSFVKTGAIQDTLYPGAKMNFCRTFHVYFRFLRNSVRQTHPKCCSIFMSFREYQRKEGCASFTCLNGTFARVRSKAVWHFGSTESLGDVCVLRLDVRHLRVYRCTVQTAFCCSNGCLIPIECQGQRE